MLLSSGLQNNPVAVAEDFDALYAHLLACLKDMTTCQNHTRCTSHTRQSSHDMAVVAEAIAGDVEEGDGRGHL